MEIVLALLVGLAIGVGLGTGVLLVYQRSQGRAKKRQAEDEAIASPVRRRRKSGEAVVINARDEALHLSEKPKTMQESRAELDRESDRLQKAPRSKTQRYEQHELRERTLNKAQSKLDKHRRESTQNAGGQKADLSASPR